MGTMLGRTIIAGACALAAWWAGCAQALTVTYDLRSNRGPITLRFDADDADADTRLTFQGGEADISSLLDITLTFGGVDYTLIGAVDPDVGLVDSRDASMSFFVTALARPHENTLTTVDLTFSRRMRRIRTLGDLFAYFQASRIQRGNLAVSSAQAPVPLPGALALFAVGLAGLAGARRGL